MPDGVCKLLVVYLIVVFSMTSSSVYFLQSQCLICTPR